MVHTELPSRPGKNYESKQSYSNARSFVRTVMPWKLIMIHKKKTCLTCWIEKPVTEFQKRGGKRKGFQASRKRCDIERTRIYRTKTRKLLSRWKSQKGCQECGFKAEHPCQLDIDHIDKNLKDKKSGGRAIDPSWSYQRIKNELSNCQVLCKNCHSVKTFLNKEHL